MLFNSSYSCLLCEASVALHVFGGCQKGAGGRRSDLSEKCRSMGLTFASRWTVCILICWFQKKNGTNHRETQKYHELAWFFECMLLVLDSIILVFYLLGLCHSMKPDCCSGKWKRCSHPTRIFEELNWKRNSSWRWPHAKPRWNEGKAVGIVPQQTEIKKLVHPNINAM